MLIHSAAAAIVDYLSGILSRFQFQSIDHGLVDGVSFIDGNIIQYRGSSDLQSVRYVATSLS